MLKREDPFTPKATSKRSRERPGTPTKAAAVGEDEQNEAVLTPLKLTLSALQASPLPKQDFDSPRRDSLSGNLTATNDDEMEKIKNRAELIKRNIEKKSALKSPAPEASPRAESTRSSLSATPTRARSGSLLGSSAEGLANLVAHSPLALAAAANRSTRSLSCSKLSTSAPVASLDSMSKTFDEWMKLAADNKINTKNSWNFALIDYFSELTFIRDGDSINFQKASCTLDGCVKIYASRVDSVVDETTKLISGLSDKASGMDKDKEKGNADDEEEDQNVSTTQAKFRRRNTNRAAVETLEKNLEALNLKNFELEFSVDPLFKKTSAEFDETGGHGSLLHSLAVDPRNQLIIFDDSDKIAIDFGNRLDSLQEEEDFSVDLSAFQDQIPDLTVNLERRCLCPTFHEYSFSDSQFNINETLTKLSRMSERFSQPTPLPLAEFSNAAYSAGNDLFAGDDHYSLSEHEDDFDDDDDQFTARRNSEFLYDNNDTHMGADDEPQDHVPGRPSRANRQSGEFEWGGMDHSASKLDESGLSYFDNAFKKTWAGPEHWKIRRGPTHNREISAIAASSRKGSKAAEKTGIDFAKVAVDYRQLFSKAAVASSITLTKAMILERKQERHLLPDDLHFTSANLLKLFIKPNLKLIGRRASNEREERVVDGSFWTAQRKEARPSGILDRLRAENGAGRDDDAEKQDVTFEDIYEDYYDDFGAATEPHMSQSRTPLKVATTPGRGLVDFSQQLVSAPKLSFAPALSYARVAKRVDIAKLKATLWQEFLETSNVSKATSPTKSRPSREASMRSEAGADDANAPNTFSHLMSNLSKTYPTEALAEVSVPYCFICLLHLANENNLEIKPMDSDLLILNE